MNTGAGWSPQDAWRQFRLEAEAARHYPRSYALYIMQTHRDLLLERLLPTLLYLKGVAILDDALELWLATNGHQLSKPYKDDLNGRLRYFEDKGLLADTRELHRIRNQRNALAHEAEAVCTWDELSRDVLLVEAALLSLGLVRPTKELTYFAERSALEDSAEPGIAFTRRITYGVKEAGRPALEISFTQKFHKD